MQRLQIMFGYGVLPKQEFSEAITGWKKTGLEPK